LRYLGVNRCQELTDIRPFQELDRPLIFIGHSLGGLVIESALCLAYQSLSTRSGQYHHIYNLTKKLILFGTPHLGS
ncbi:hypothetical protein QBC34DRAFT_257958, partial [Podospora aff. communis PSN243]